MFGNQRRIAAEFILQLRPWIAQDRALPVRIERLLKSDRRLGARDRRLYRELIYTYLRFRPWLDALPSGGPSSPGRSESKLPGKDRAPPDFPGAIPPVAAAPADGPWFEALAWLAADTPATAKFRQGTLAQAQRAWPPCPARVEDKASILAAFASETAPLPSLLPEWCAAECPVALEPLEYDALHRRAALWLRVHRPEDVAAVIAELREHALPAASAEALVTAIRVDGEADLTKTRAFQAGLFEIQDLGSQLILVQAAPAPGETWLDACAGAGGKALQLAGLLGPQGRVHVHDIRPAALAELDARARRAGLAPRMLRLPGGDPRARAPYDGVLVDAPCSGTGTWRRAPHLKWSTTPALVGEAAAAQAELLRAHAALVRPGGRLVYATCSLCERENAAQIAGFLAAQPGYRPEFQRLIRPSAADTDGFFVASLRRAP